jgi:aldose 1-epimerase
METTQARYGNLPDGQEISEFTLRNSNGMVVRLINYGAIITSIQTPDRRGKIDEITLGFDSLDRYASKHPFFGATVGRFANRIAGGSFTLDGQTYSLARNNGPNHLHGGLIGFDKRVFSAEPFVHGSVAGVTMGYVSADGEEGYPGRLTASVTFSLTERNELDIHYEAQTDRPTIVNLTNHAYFNLAGAGSGSILSHEITLHADSYLPVGEGLIPTGAIAPVEGTPFDFRTQKPIGKDLGRVGGYDHCFVIRKDAAAALAGPNARPLYAAARLHEPQSGRGLELFATQPGVQFYTGNNLPDMTGRGGKSYSKHSAVCLETEAFPDAINHANFPSCVLRPGERYDEIAKLYFFAR